MVYNWLFYLKSGRIARYLEVGRMIAVIRASATG